MSNINSTYFYIFTELHKALTTYKVELNGVQHNTCLAFFYTLSSY